MPSVPLEAVLQQPYFTDEETGPDKLICFSPILPLPPPLITFKHQPKRLEAQKWEVISSIHWTFIYTTIRDCVSVCFNGKVCLSCRV